MEQISTDLFNEWSERRKVDRELSQSLNERSKLPIFSMKEQILEAIDQNSVILIRGNTGCGKTTQVKYLIAFYLYNSSIL